jgi:hypothetical protein
MADYDPQQAAENESNNAPKRDESRHESCDASGQQGSGESGCGCGSYGKYDGNYDGESLDRSRDFDTSRADSFVADWSGAEQSLADQAESFEARKAELAGAEGDQGMSQQFWSDLVQSQQPAGSGGLWKDLVRSQQPQTESVALTVRGESVEGQSGQLWSDLVRSQQPSPTELSEPAVSSSHSKPTGMGWGEDEASEWAPPEREYEPAGAAAEPVDADGAESSRRDDVAWSTPVSAQDDWESVRTEALTAESRPETQPQSLMDAAVAAAEQQAQPKQKKARAPRKPAAKKPAAAKKTVAKKPAKKSVKKSVAKKVVKKAPAPRIDPGPTRRAA